MGRLGYKTATTHKRRFYELCLKIAKLYPEWSAERVEAEATKLTLGIKPKYKKLRGLVNHENPL